MPEIAVLAELKLRVDSDYAQEGVDELCSLLEQMMELLLSLAESLTERKAAEHAVEVYSICESLDTVFELTENIRIELGLIIAAADSLSTILKYEEISLLE